MRSGSALDILVVDDDEPLREMLTRSFEREGHRVTAVPDGQSALERAAERQFDVVLLDVALPDIDGFDVASRLTANGSAPAVILVSSRDPADFGPLVSRSGARGFVPKGELSGDRLEALL